MARIISKLVISLILLISVPAFAGVGSISEFQGGGTIKRGAKASSAFKGSNIEKNDTISTNSQGRFKITFVDATTVNITQNSKLVVDDFVYNPNDRGRGKIGLKLALGTAKYTSGAIAKGNARGVGIRTPTATIAVRGTDFVMSVDEAGRSTVVLVPECYNDKDITKINFDCPVGAIDVMTAAGLVTLNKPFQATMVENSYAPPAPPITIDPTLSGMDNSIQIAPLETDGGQSLVDAARESLKKYTNPAKAASDENKDPNTGNENVEEASIITLRMATQAELQEIYAEFNEGSRPRETIYTNVSPTFKKLVQSGWVYSRISEDKNQAVVVWMPKDTEVELISSQNGIVDSYNFMDHKWTSSGTGRPQGNITVIQESGVR